MRHDAVQRGWLCASDVSHGSPGYVISRVKLLLLPLVLPPSPLLMLDAEAAVMDGFTHR